jgi:hypothetical protein
MWVWEWALPLCWLLFLWPVIEVVLNVPGVPRVANLHEPQFEPVIIFLSRVIIAVLWSVVVPLLAT